MISILIFTRLQLSTLLMYTLLLAELYILQVNYAMKIHLHNKIYISLIYNKIVVNQIGKHFLS